MNTKVNSILLFAALILSYFSCITAPDFPDEPVLEFDSFSKTSMMQGRTANDSIFLTVTFTDGDGDIGSDEIVNLQLIDRRTGEDYGVFRVPPIPEAGANNGVEVEMKIKVFNTCCLQPDGEEVCEDVTVPSNELSFDVIITDRAGNISNTLTTPSINLICN